jgi:glycosyltransferase involved in cell wall biosynthesis
MKTVYLDLTHLGRHVTGIERVTIEQFEKVTFAGADVCHVRSGGLAAMIFKQQVLLPVLALVKPNALFVFPGFPPSPLFRFFRNRTVLYVHDLFLVTRRNDLSRKARLYMAAPFRMAVTGLRYFMANSEKTRSELQPFVRSDASIALYRPTVDNIFGLTPDARRKTRDQGQPVTLVSLGTVEPRKNYGAALAILDALRLTTAPDAELHIVGRKGWGPDAERLSQHPGVVVHGYLPTDAAKTILEASDIYLCTSHDEGLGLPLIEAQFAGLPVVAPDAPVFREVLGESGTFIDPSNARASAVSLTELLGNPAHRAIAADAALANTTRWNRIAAQDRERVIALFMHPLDQSIPALDDSIKAV